MNTITDRAVVAADEKPLGILKTIAEKYHMDAAPFQSMILATCFTAKDKSGALVTPSPAELAAFLVVAHEYGLNPILKEIYGFKSQSGAIVPIVPIDGWTNIINSNPKFDGMEFTDTSNEAGTVVEAVTCRIYRKDRSHPIEVTEYLAECRRDTVPWKQYPKRMLRHKAMIQCARYAFGLAGIYDPDEGERIDEATAPARVVPPSIPGKPTIEAEFSEVKGELQETTPVPPPIPAETNGKKERKPRSDKGVKRTVETNVTETENPAPPAIPKAGVELDTIPPVEPLKPFLAWLDAKLKTFERYETLETWWNDNIKHRMEEMFPLDADDALKVFAKHEERLNG